MRGRGVVSFGSSPSAAVLSLGTHSGPSPPICVDLRGPGVGRGARRGGGAAGRLASCTSGSSSRRPLGAIALARDAAHLGLHPRELAILRALVGTCEDRESRRPDEDDDGSTGRRPEPERRACPAGRPERASGRDRSGIGPEGRAPFRLSSVPQRRTLPQNGPRNGPRTGQFLADSDLYGTSDLRQSQGEGVSSAPRAM